MLQRGRGDGDAKYALTKVRQEGIAGRGGRGDYDCFAGELNWTVVQRQRHHTMAEHSGGNGERDASVVGTRREQRARCEMGAAAARRWVHLLRHDVVGPTAAYGRHAASARCARSAMTTPV